MTRRFTVAVIPGDGIGPEVIDAAIPAIENAARWGSAAIRWRHLPYGAEHFIRTGETLPDAAFVMLQSECQGILLGALGDPRVPDNEHARDILLGLRTRLDLYVNFRPCRLWSQDLCPLSSFSEEADGAGKDIDIAIFRENTEGLYLGRGRIAQEGTPDEEHIAEEVHTSTGVSRIIRAAFEWARTHRRSRITLCDKSNAIPAHRLWGRVFGEIGSQYPEIEREHRYADALAMELIRDPARFDVIVANNLLGDILSDIAAELVGGLGLAPSANLHPGRPGLFEPVHGSAPSLAGRDVANPMAVLLTGALMLEALGLPAEAGRLEDGVRAALNAGVRTADLGGSASTREVGAWIAGHLSTDVARPH